MQSEENAARTVAEASAESRLLAALLAKAQPGDLVSYEQMEAAAGLDVRSSRGRNLLRTARNRVRADQGLIFVAVAGRGYRRALEQEKPGLMAGVAEHIHRAARNGMKVAATVDLSALGEAEKSEWAMRASQLGALAQFTGAKAEKAIAAGIEKPGRELPLTKTLEATLEAFKK